MILTLKSLSAFAASPFDEREKFRLGTKIIIY